MYYYYAISVMMCVAVILACGILAASVPTGTVTTSTGGGGVVPGFAYGTTTKLINYDGSELFLSAILRQLQNGSFICDSFVQNGKSFTIIPGCKAFARNFTASDVLTSSSSNVFGLFNTN